MTTLALLESRENVGKGDHRMRMTHEEIIASVVGKKVKELVWSDVDPEAWIGFVLDDGTKVLADGGEDGQGGYGFLEIAEGE